MPEKRIVSRVASGLRRMKVHPDIFVFIDGNTEWTWDEGNILGIPVFHTTHIRFAPYSDYECPFLPCFCGEADIVTVGAFARGYYEEDEDA